MFITITNYLANWMCNDLMKKLEEKTIRINELEEEVDELCYKVQELEVELENKEGELWEELETEAEQRWVDKLQEKAQDFEDLHKRFSQIAHIIHQ